MKNTHKLLTILIVFLALACSKDDVPTTTTPTPIPTPTVTKSSAKVITKFSFAALSPAIDATIDEATKAITTTVPAATDVTKLVPTITLSDKSTMSPASGVAQDFSKEVNYTVTAEDASTVVYKVNVTKTVPLLDMVYVGNFDGNLYAFDLATGSKKWSYNIGGRTIASPIVANGIVYIGSRQYLPEISKFYALDATSGKLLWSKSLGDGQIYSSPIVSNGIVYTATFSGTQSIFALDVATGVEKWNYRPAGVSPAFTSDPVVADGVVYIGCYDGNMYALDAVSGKLKWSFKTNPTAPTIISQVQSPCLENGILYFGGQSTTTTYNFYAVEAATGKQKWVVPIKNSPKGIPLFFNGLVYFGDTSGNFYALDATTGTTKWTLKIQYSIYSSPSEANGIIYFIGGDNILYALDAVTGAKKWTYQASGTPANNSYTPSPTVVNNIVYLGADVKTFNTFDATTGAKKWSFTGTDVFISSPCIVFKGQIYRGLGGIRP